MDFVTKTISRQEVHAVMINYTLWKEIVMKIGEKTNATILMVFDFGSSDDTSLAIFSQHLTLDQQRHLLKQIHDVCEKLGIVPTYPIHRGYKGSNAKILSYGKYRFYDALDLNLKPMIL